MSEPQSTTMSRAEECWLAAALEERFRGLGPPDLTDAILTAHARDVRAAPRRKRLVAAAVLAAGLATVALVPILDRIEPAQDPEGSYLPLGIGAEWEYEVAGDRYIERVLGSTRMDGRAVYLLHQMPQPVITASGSGSVRIWRLDGGDPRFRFLAVDESGVWRLPNDPRRPLLHPDPTPVRVLALPLAQGATWEWTFTERLAREGAQVGPDPEETVHSKAAVIALNEEVAVPAGRFRAVHVRIETTGETVPVVEDVFYAPGTGIVRSDLRAGDSTDASVVRRELVRFTPGRATLDWERDLPPLLAKDRGLGRRGMPETIVPVSLGRHPSMLARPGERGRSIHLPFVLQSRFAFLRWRDGELLVRMSMDRDGSLSVFDPGDLEDWNDLVMSEPYYEVPGLSAPEATAVLAELAGQLHAAVAGMDVTGIFRVESAAVRVDTCRMTGLLPVRSANGDADLSCSATMEIAIEKRRVTAIEVR